MKFEFRIGDIVQTTLGVEAEIEEIHIRKTSVVYKLKGVKRCYSAKTLTLISEE